VLARLQLWISEQGSRLTWIDAGADQMPRFVLG
jgi:hypothetical protein